MSIITTPIPVIWEILSQKIDLNNTAKNMEQKYHKPTKTTKNSTRTFKKKSQKVAILYLSKGSDESLRQTSFLKPNKNKDNKD